MRSTEILIITIYHSETEATEAVMNEIMANPRLPSGWHLQVTKSSSNPLVKGEFKTEAYFAPKDYWGAIDKLKP